MADEGRGSWGLVCYLCTCAVGYLRPITHSSKTEIWHWHNSQCTIKCGNNYGMFKILILNSSPNTVFTLMWSPHIIGDLPCKSPDGILTNLKGFQPQHSLHKYVVNVVFISKCADEHKFLLVISLVFHLFCCVADPFSILSQMHTLRDYKSPSCLYPLHLNGSQRDHRTPRNITPAFPRAMWLGKICEASLTVSLYSVSQEWNTAYVCVHVLEWWPLYT